MKPKRWVPKINEYYYTLIPKTPMSTIVIDLEIRGCMRMSLKDSNYKTNCFRTKREAEEALRKIEKILRGI